MEMVKIDSVRRNRGPLVPLTSTDHDVPYPAGCRRPVNPTRGPKPTWGGKNRPLPDTGKRVNTPGQQQDFAAPYKDGRPQHKAAQEGKAAKDTEDPLVKLERVVELLDSGLLSVREYGDFRFCVCKNNKRTIDRSGVATRRRRTARRQPPAAHADSGAATFHCKCALQTERHFFLAVARVSGIAYRGGTNGRLLWVVEACT